MDQVPFQNLRTEDIMKLNDRAKIVFFSKCQCINSLKTTSNAWSAYYAAYLNARYPDTTIHIPKKGDNKGS